jgi:hypothetical protein
MSMGVREEASKPRAEDNGEKDDVDFTRIDRMESKYWVDEGDLPLF